MANSSPKKPTPKATHPWKKSVLYSNEVLTAEKFNTIQARYYDMLKEGVRNETFRYLQFQMKAHLGRQAQGKLS